MSLAVINNYKRLNYLMDIILSSRKNNLQTLSTKHCFTGFADNIYDNEIYVSQLQNRLISKIPVSYTHLDVYKRQRYGRALFHTSSEERVAPPSEEK